MLSKLHLFVTRKFPNDDMEPSTMLDYKTCQRFYKTKLSNNDHILWASVDTTLALSAGRLLAGTTSALSATKRGPDPNRSTRRAFFWQLALTHTSDPIWPTRWGPDPIRLTRRDPDPIQPMRRGPDRNRPTKWAFFWKLPLTRTPDPNRFTRQCPDPNRLTRRAFFKEADRDPSAGRQCQCSVYPRQYFMYADWHCQCSGTVTAVHESVPQCLKIWLRFVALYKYDWLIVPSLYSVN